MNLETFLNNHCVEKNSDKEITHQQFGKYQKKNYSITGSDYDTFIKLYTNSVLKANRTHNLIERQTIHKQKDNGMHLVDLDLNFQADYTSRQYTEKHITTCIDFILELYQKYYMIDDDCQFPISVLEKPSPRVVNKNSGTIVKDGIHLMFGISLDPYMLMNIRVQLIEFLRKAWEDLPVINSWEDVVDKAISDGANGWLVPNSKKEDEPSYYSITKAYHAYFDTDQSKFVINQIVYKPDDLKSFYSQYYKSLFIRNTEHLPALELLTDEGETAIEQFKTKKISTKTTGGQPGNDAFGGDDPWQIPVDIIRTINNYEDATALLHGFLDNLPSDKYILKTAHDYVNILPESYYGQGSYNKWIRVGLVLFNTSRYLLIVWLMFSAKASNFDWNESVMCICDHWEKWKSNTVPHERLTIQSLMYWCKVDVPDQFLVVRDSSINHLIEQSIYGLTVAQMKARGKHKGSTDYDLAKVAHGLYNGVYVASSIKSNEWWVIRKHYWEKDDSGTSLRMKISTEVRNLYHQKAMEYLQKAMLIKTPEGLVDTENEEYQLLMAKCDYLREISDRLGNTKDKDNIMRECREIFFDREFIKKLDVQRHLLCFNNGVMDFKSKEFRAGKPDDFISKCTQTDYKPLDRENDMTSIKEIETYFHELFPRIEMYEYMWVHMASLMTGETEKTQCLHYYHGNGSNGKSLLINLFEDIFGDYAVSLDANFFTGSRSGRGSATPDMAKLPGSRLAITQEPTEGGKPVVLTEGPMKQLTSGTDRINYRSLYKDEEHFQPQCHSIICANDYIPIRSLDDGTWRRIRVVPFESVFTENPKHDDPDKPYQFHVDREIKMKFKTWVPVITAMLVEKAFEYKGLVPICPIVAKASANYRRREDYVSAFIEDHFEPCEPNPYERLQKSVVQRLFTDWYTKEYGEKTSNKLHVIYDAMTKRYGDLKKHPTPGWDGVRQIKLYADEPNTDQDDDD
mgnify:CR=1 FL=1